MNKGRAKQFNIIMQFLLETPQKATLQENRANIKCAIGKAPEFHNIITKMTGLAEFE